MSITPCAIDPRRAEPPADAAYAAVVDPAEKLRKRAYTGFAASAGIVLVIAICYVAVRVFSQPRTHSSVAVTAKVARPVSPPPIRIQTLSPPPALAAPVVVQASEPAKVQPQPLPAPAPTPAPVKSIGSPAPGQAWTAVTPHTGETYLQVIALNERFVQSYVDGLRAKGLHPLVAVSPLDNVYRILFGPLKDQKARELERKDLEAAGLQPLVQVY